MNRPFRYDHSEGAALLGQGIREGVNSFAKNFLDMRQQNTYQRLTDLNGRRQALNEGIVSGELAPLGGGGIAFAPTPDPLNERGLYPQSLNSSPVGPPVPNVGADALATNPPIRRSAADMSEDALRDAAFSHTVQSREHALANENDLDMLKQAYHYNTLMTASKPYLDTWARVLDEARRNPDKSQWRGVMVMTGQEDPDKAFAAATQEYLKLRSQYGQYRQAYDPLGAQLKSRGITPDLYDDEAKFLQLLNQRKFQPHTPRMGTMPVPGSGGPYRGRRFGGQSR